MTTKAKARPTAAKKKAPSGRPVAKKATTAATSSGSKSAGAKGPATSSPPRKQKAPAPAAAKAPVRRVRLPDDMPVVTDAESLEFLKAIDAFKRRTGKPFPTWTQVLGVAKALGYVRD